MPPSQKDEGMGAALEIRAAEPDIAILVLSHHVEGPYAVELLADDPHGVGYLLKQRVADLDRFYDALDRIVIDPEVVAAMRGRAHRDPSTPSPRASARSWALMAEGRTNAGIAAELVVTEKAVAKHAASIFRRPRTTADGHRRVLAVVRYLSR